jgi:hypothetical protein
MWRDTAAILVGCQRSAYKPKLRRKIRKWRETINSEHLSSCLSSSFLSSASWLIAYDHHILRSRTLWHILHSTTIKRKPRQLPTMKHFTRNIWVLYQENKSSSAVLWLAFLPLDPTFAGSNPAVAIDFKGYKYPQHSFLRRGSKAGGRMSERDFTSC